MNTRQSQEIILVDTNHRQLRLVQSVLKNRVDCTLLYSGQMACQYLKQYAETRQTKPPLMVVDCMLSDMDIFELLRQIRLICIEKPHIIVTGPGKYSETVRVKLLQSGADYYMLKPYKIATLCDCIEMFYQKPLLVKRSSWDESILYVLDNVGLARGESGYWHLAACLQGWLGEGKRPPQLKGIYLDVSRDFHITAKGVESGIHRAARSLYEIGAFKTVLKNKELITVLATKIREKQEESMQEYGNDDNENEHAGAV